MNTLSWKKKVVEDNLGEAGGNTGNQSTLYTYMKVSKKKLKSPTIIIRIGKDAVAFKSST